MPPRSNAKRRAPQAPAKRALPRVEPEDLADFNDSINILLAGDSGVGKTPLAAQAPEAVILSTEKGSISAKRFGSTAKLMRCPTWDHVMAGLKWIDDNPGKFKWLIVDSLTKMQVLQIRWILERVHEDNESRDLDVPALADHQKWQNMFKRFVDRIVDMDINVIFITTLMHKEDSEGEDLTLPNIQGKDYAIAQYVCEQMDGVYVLKAITDQKSGEPFWRLLTKFRAPYFAKDRYDAFGGSVVERPTMPEIIAAIEASGEYAAGEQPKAKPKSRKAATETDDWDEEDNPFEEDEEHAKPTRARGKAKPKAKASRRSTAKSEPSEDEDEDEYDPRDELDEDGRDSHTKTSRRNKVTAAANRNRRKAKVEEPDDEEEPDEEDWFDPDEEDSDEDLDFDDE